MDKVEQWKHEKEEAFVTLKILVSLLEDDLRGEDPEDVIGFIEPITLEVFKRIRIVEDIKQSRRMEADAIIKSIKP